MVKYPVRLLLFAALLATAQVQAQQTAAFHDPAREFREALEMYDQQRYNLAFNRFSRFVESYSEVDEGRSGLLLADAAYYRAASAARQQDPAAESYYLEYLDQYKGHSLNNMALLDLGHLAFETRQYNIALDYYNRVDDKALNKRFHDEFAFRRGFSYFSIKQFDTAMRAWEELLRDQTGEYYHEANYYYGMAAYFREDYDRALSAFTVAESQPKYRTVVPYYLAQIRYLQGDYQGVLDYAVPLLDRPGLRNVAEINQLAGQSAFALERYEEAARYLDAYVRLAGKASREDYYQLGYAQYKTGDYTGALKNFGELAHLDHPLAQNALFHMGDAYLKTGDRERARTVLQQAASMTYDEALTEHARFSAAKLNYELGYGNEALVGLRKFIADYPNSAYQEEANELLAGLLLETRNYDEALAIIEQMASPSAKIREAYQVMAYHKAISLYNDGRLNQALEALNKAERYTPDKGLLALTHYWRGDIFYRKGEYRNSMAEMDAYLKSTATIPADYNSRVSPGTAHYVQGYNHYKTEDFAKAADAFKRASDLLAGPSGEAVRGDLLPDALLRTADCHFLRKEYGPSETYYDKVISKRYEGSDYAMYQKALIQGLRGKYEDKVAQLRAMQTAFPQSVLADDAAYETGNTYIVLNRSADAISAFEGLIRTYPSSEWVAPAHLKIGLIHFNEDRFQQALASYKTVVSRFPRTTSSSEALLAIRDVYVAMGDPQGYIAYVQQVPGAAVTVSEQDSVLYLSAENLFTKGEYGKALQAFDEYLLRFPEGYFSLPARFYRGECQFSFQKFGKAVADYDYVLKQARNRFTERSLQRAAAIRFYHLADYGEALELYLELNEQATTTENRLNAVLGAMRCYHQLKDYAKTGEYADRVYGDEAFTEQQRNEALYYRAVSRWHTGNRWGAVADFTTIRNTLSNEWAAEATYRIALDHFENGRLDEAEATCFEFSRNYPAYASLLVRTYLVLADVYLARDNLLQARATVQSILDNYRNDDEWRAQALQKLEAIKALEAERSRIAPTGQEGDELQFDE